MSEPMTSQQRNTAASRAVTEQQAAPTLAEPLDAFTGPTRYRDGEIIEYTSFDQSGYSTGQVVRYAPDPEQWSPCPNCGQQAMPGEQHGDLRRCPRCQAFVRFPDLGPVVYIRTRSGSKPFQVRESQLRPRRSTDAPPQ